MIIICSSSLIFFHRVSLVIYLLNTMILLSIQIKSSPVAVLRLDFKALVATNNGQKITNNRQEMKDDEWRMTDNRWWMTNKDNGWRTTDNRWKSMDNGWRTTDHGQQTRGEQIMDGRQWMMNDRKWMMDGKWWTMDGKWQTMAKNNGWQVADNQVSPLTALPLSFFTWDAGAMLADDG